MDRLGLFTTLSVGLMIGNEVAVSAFVDPALWAGQEIAMASLLAARLGKVMPFWYGLCLVLLGSDAWMHHGRPGGGLLVAAAVGWAGAIVYTLVALVPINNRLADPAGRLEGKEFWRQHRRWDWLHRVRVGLLTACFVLFLLGQG